MNNFVDSITSKILFIRKNQSSNNYLEYLDFLSQKINTHYSFLKNKSYWLSQTRTSY